MEVGIKDDSLAKFPDHSILAEESGETASSSEYLWVIDPLDGTTNFAHNLPIFAVSIITVALLFSTLMYPEFFKLVI